MLSLKDLKTRISSVKSTRKITKAMQMVAASKLRRAQEAAEAARPYAERMSKVLASLAAGAASGGQAPRLLTGTGKEDVHLLIVCTSDRGLCGGFNTQIIRAVRRRLLELRAEGREIKILCVGRKGRDQLNREYGDLILDTVELKRVKQVSFAQAEPIARRVLEMFADEAFDVCTIYYNHFQSVMNQILTAQTIIPATVADVQVGQGAEPGDGADLGGAIYDYEPDEEEILAQLLPRNFAVQILRALLENAASEQGSRMTAMDSATRNAGEMIDKLTLTYNRARQASITKELIEIISGAEAV